MEVSFLLFRLFFYIFPLVMKLFKIVFYFTPKVYLHCPREEPHSFHLTGILGKSGRVCRPLLISWGLWKMHEKLFLHCCNKAGLVLIFHPGEKRFRSERPFNRYKWLLGSITMSIEKQDISGNLNRMANKNNLNTFIFNNSQVQGADICQVSGIWLSTLHVWFYSIFSMTL